MRHGTAGKTEAFPVEVSFLGTDINGRRVFVSVFRDIAPRKRAEEMLTAERTFLNTVLDIAGALVVVLDPKGRIVRFNKTCEKKNGYSSAEVLGKVFWDFLLTEHEKPGGIEIYPFWWVCQKQHSQVRLQTGPTGFPDR